MSVDYVRVYQKLEDVNTGCDPDNFPRLQFATVCSETRPSLYPRHIAENCLGFSRNVWNWSNDHLGLFVVTKGIVYNSDGSWKTRRRRRLNTYMLRTLILCARCDLTSLWISSDDLFGTSMIRGRSSARSESQSVVSAKCGRKKEVWGNTKEIPASGHQFTGCSPSGTSRTSLDIYCA